MALVPLTRQHLMGALPSKMFDAMACQRPVILSAEAEACTVLRNADAGLVIPPEDADALVAAVLTIAEEM